MYLETCSELFQTYKVEIFVRIIDRWKLIGGQQVETLLDFDMVFNNQQGHLFEIHFLIHPWKYFQYFVDFLVTETTFVHQDSKRNLYHTNMSLLFQVRSLLGYIRVISLMFQ